MILQQAVKPLTFCPKREYVQKCTDFSQDRELFNSLMSMTPERAAKGILVLVFTQNNL